LKNQPERAEALRQAFPIRDRYTVSGHVVGDVCFTCRCRVLEIGGDDGMVLAWCGCEWPPDAHDMEVL
jgi:hypothetical protein